MNRREVLWLLAVLTMPPAVRGQQSECVEKRNELSLNLQFLSHGETRTGGLTSYDIQKNGGSKRDEERSRFLMGRTRLTLDYKSPGIEARVVGQNTAIWGMGGDKSFSLYEAWVKLPTKIGLFAQIGRQALSYDDERIIGPNDWAMASNSHDVLKLGYEGHGHKAHVILAYNQNDDNTESGTTYYSNLENGTGSQLYKTMHVGWYHYDVPTVPLGASLLFMNTGMQAGNINGKNDNAPHTNFQQLYGGYISFHPKGFSLEGSYYHQAGKDEYDMEIDGWMASAKATVNPHRLFSIEAGYDYLSGDESFPVPNPDTPFAMIYHEKQQSFRPLYGSHHKFYGAMDYFYTSAYVQGFSPGLRNIYGGVTAFPFKNFTLKAAYHYLAINTDLEMSKTLGHELEFEASYTFSRNISLQAGFSFMTGTETLDKLKRNTGNENLRWGWFSLVISPNTFTTKW